MKFKILIKILIEFDNDPGKIKTGVAKFFNFTAIPGVLFLEFKDGETRYYPLVNIREIIVLEVKS